MVESDLSEGLNPRFPGDKTIGFPCKKGENREKEGGKPSLLGGAKESSEKATLAEPGAQNACRATRLVVCRSQAQHNVLLSR